MQYRAVVGLSLCLLALSGLLPIHGAAPVKVASVAPIEDLVAAATAKSNQLSEYLKSEESYNEAKKELIPQAAGVLACIAQAIAEHDKHGDANVVGAELRDAALATKHSKSLEDARKDLKKIEAALQGESSGEAEMDYKWSDLVNIHQTMKEVNALFATLPRPIGDLRRGRKLKSEEFQKVRLHASTLVVLSLVIQTHGGQVEKKGDVAKWQGLSTELQESLAALGAAIRKKDGKQSYAFLRRTREACKSCHDQFRKE